MSYQDDLKFLHHIDWGTLNNFPIELIKKYCDHIIGVNVNPLGKEKIENLNYFYSIIERAYHIKMANESLSKFEECDVFINPNNFENYKLFSVKNADAIFQLGYEAANEVLKNNVMLKTTSDLAAELEVVNGFSL